MYGPEKPKLKCLGFTYNGAKLFNMLPIQMKWKLIERKYALRSITKKKLNVPEKPKLKCLGFIYNGAKLFNMLQNEENRKPKYLKKYDKKLDMGKHPFISVITIYFIIIAVL